MLHASIDAGHCIGPTAYVCEEAAQSEKRVFVCVCLRARANVFSCFGARAPGLNAACATEFFIPSRELDEPQEAIGAIEAIHPDQHHINTDTGVDESSLSTAYGNRGHTPSVPVRVSTCSACALCGTKNACVARVYASSVLASAPSTQQSRMLMIIHTHTKSHTQTHTHTHTICICVCMYVYVYTYVHVCVCIYNMYAYIYVCMHACMHACMHVFPCMYFT
jgi:hypothetical protein